MKKSLRVSRAGATYHVTTKCNDPHFTFQDDSEVELYLKILEAAKERYKAVVHDFYLENSHFHLIVTTPHEDNISVFMRYLNGRFAQAYNRKHGISGYFWARKFRSTILDEKESSAL